MRGLLASTHFNWLCMDRSQGRKPSCPYAKWSYVSKATWDSTTSNDRKEQNDIQATAGFSYCMATGELIYALVIARPEISFAITKPTTQYGSSGPALIHYQAVWQVYAFLNNTREDGLIFWRREPWADLPDIPRPRTRSNPNDWLPTPTTHPTSPVAYSDLDWGSDTTHRRSVSGIIIMVAGTCGKPT